MKRIPHTPYPIPHTLFILLFLAASLHALPVGDPRTPDSETLSKMDIPIEQGIHELSVHAFMGASKIDYPDVGGTQFSPGFGAAITYNFFFLPKWSFLVGGGIQLFNNRGTEVESDFSSDDRNGPGPIRGTDVNDFLDDGSSQVYLYYDFKGYSETQWSMMFMVPIMLQYQSNESRNKAFYYALGVKLGFPFAGAYQGKAEGSKVCGYYPDLWGVPANNGRNISFAECNSEYFGEGNRSEDLGFGDFGTVNSYSKLKFGSAFFAAAEAGVKWRLYSKLAVYTGFWLDWGLNDIAISAVSGDRPFNWTPTKGQSEDGVTPKADVEFKSRTNGRAYPMSLGFAVRFSLGAGSHHPVSDSARWLREIAERDSLLALCRERNASLAADSARAADSIAYLNDKADALLDSLIDCRSKCLGDVDRDALKRQIDSLAREAEARRLADLERARQAALEQARLDSIEDANRLAAQRAARLADFRRKLAELANGLDDYKVTQTIPSDNAKEKLDIAAELMGDYPDLRLHFVGHTCDKGTHEANRRFGQQRAESARNYLASKGVDASRIEVSSKAELEPVVPNTSEENRRKNRRVQIIIIENGQEAK